ncbi:U-box domain-containing protein 34-like [Dorcoceras hygrometricum]|uniref:U-box domain-containing protein 34-like n=1 Tax=Dorcoceras hygrometricum TaxID=472368 RepID=A0A2Z7ATC6_9LAMI|nr:U-box domain-containing protein 34-like [Dorcoceras hygrometricum]
MTFRVVRTNQYNQDLDLIHSTNGNHLERRNEGSSIDHQVTIHLHAQNITMFLTNETCVGTRRSDQAKRFDKIVQQQVTVAKSMRVNTTVARDWSNFEIQLKR